MRVLLVGDERKAASSLRENADAGRKEEEQ